MVCSKRYAIFFLINGLPDIATINRELKTNDFSENLLLSAFNI